MKVTIEYSTEDESPEAISIIKARNMAFALSEIGEALRKRAKYSECCHESIAADAIREEFYAILDDNEINIDEMVL